MSSIASDSAFTLASIQDNIWVEWALAWFYTFHYTLNAMKYRMG